MAGGITSFFLKLGDIFNSPVNVSVSNGGGIPAEQQGSIEPHTINHEDPQHPQHEGGADAHHPDDHAPLLVEHDDHHHTDDDSHHYDDDADYDHHHG